MTAIATTRRQVPQRIDQRLHALATTAGPEHAAKAVGIVLAAYRASLIDDPRTFLRLAVAALEDFPATVLEDLANPKIGIMRDCTFPPSVAELVKWCERRKAHRLLEDGRFRDEAEHAIWWRAYQEGEEWAVAFGKKHFGGTK